MGWNSKKIKRKGLKYVCCHIIVTKVHDSNSQGFSREGFFSCHFALCRETKKFEYLRV